MKKKQLAGRPKKSAEQKCSIETKICYTVKQDEMLHDLLQKTGRKNKADLIKEIVFKKKVVVETVDQTLQLYLIHMSEISSNIEEIHQENWQQLHQIIKDDRFCEQEAIIKKIQNSLNQLSSLQQQLEHQANEVLTVWSQKYLKETV